MSQSNSVRLYNEIGRVYNQTRQPDTRIVDRLLELLDLPVGKTIADIGAGTGNYSKAIADRGYSVMAIEPSLTMQKRSQPHQQVTWVTAVAESLPLADASVDGAIVMLALHHFQNIAAGIKEIDRLVGQGKIVIFAFEQSKIADFWLSDYFPYFIQDTRKTFPSTDEIARQITKITQKEVTVTPFLLPPDLNDKFAAAGWQNPKMYLDAAVRNGISTFSKMPRDALATGLDKLEIELNNGVWWEKYGQLKQQPTYDAGYRILVAQ